MITQREFKAFYVRLNDVMKTVAAMDVLVLKVGFPKPISLNCFLLLSNLIHIYLLNLFDDALIVTFFYT